MRAPRKYPVKLMERAVREVFASARPIAQAAKDLASNVRPCGSMSGTPRPIASRRRRESCRAR
jgi:hypothetical protein